MSSLLFDSGVGRDTSTNFSFFSDQRNAPMFVPPVMAARVSPRLPPLPVSSPPAPTSELLPISQRPWSGPESASPGTTLTQRM
jgi:hypothetical protein